MRGMRFITLGLMLIGFTFSTASSLAADFDGDGVDSSVDCDDSNTAVGSRLQKNDFDQDGYGQSRKATSLQMTGVVNSQPTSVCYMEGPNIECFGTTSSLVASETMSQSWLRNFEMGETVACGLMSTGRDLLCWGDTLDRVYTENPLSQDTVEYGLGANYACEIDSFGSVYCWGDNTYEQLDAVTGSGYHGLTTGKYHSCVLDSLGEISCWGLDDRGQVTDAPTLQGYTKVAAGGSHTCALDATLAVECWGFSGYTSGYPTGSGYAEISAGPIGTCVLDDGGTLSCWGSSFLEDNVPGGTGYTSVEISTHSACATDKYRTPVCWGYENSSDIDMLIVAPVLSSCTTEVLYPIATDRGADCDDNDNQVLSPEYYYEDSDLDGVGRLGAFSKVAPGWGQGCAVTTSGSIECWGMESSGQISSAPQDTTWLDVVTVGYAQTVAYCALKDTGEVQCWGGNFEDGTWVAPVSADNVAIWGSNSNICVLSSSGSIECIGSDSLDQITNIPLGSGYTAIAMSQTGTICALSVGETI
jgi:hypothetical protein